MNRLQLMKPLDTQKDHIYYNIKIHNDGIDDTNIPIFFNENRGSPLVEKASDYYVSIIRFNLETTNLPVLLLRPDTNILTNPTKNINQLVYKIGFSFDNFESGTLNFYKNIVYIPSILNTLTTPTSINFNDKLKENSYYYVYNIQAFMIMMNETIAGILNEMSQYATTNGDVYIPPIEPPIFVFNALTGIITYKFTSFTYNGVEQPIYFGCNHSLYSVLSGFGFEYNAFKPDQYVLKYINLDFVNKDYDIVGVGETEGQKSITRDPYVFKVSQDFPSISILNPVSSVSFSTSRLPIQPTQEAKPLITGGTSLYGNNNGENNDFSPIINDFSVYNENGYAYKPSIFYNPSSEYKLNDLFGSNPISHIDILCNWIDIYGIKHPMYLESQNSAEIQLLFRKKTFQTMKKL